MKVAMYLQNNKTESGAFIFDPFKTPPTKWAVIDQEKVLFTSQSIADCESYLRLRQQELLGEPVKAPDYISFRSQDSG